MVFTIYFTKDGKYPDKDPHSLLAAALFVIIIMYLSKFLETYKIPVPIKLLIMVTSTLAAVPRYFNPSYKETTQPNPRVLLTLVHPILILKVTYNIDLPIFRRILLQVLILATIGVMVHSTLVGGILMLWRSGWDVLGLVAIPLFGFSMASTDENDTHQNDREYENLKLNYILLQGECVLGTVVCFMSLEICLGFIDGVLNNWYHVVCFIFRQIAGGVIFGGIMGKSLSFCIVQMFNEPLNVSIFTMAGVYSTYYISEYFLFFSSTLSTFIVAIMITSHRSELSEPTCFLLDHVVVFFYRMILVVITLRVAVSLTSKSTEHFEFAYFLQYVLTYVASLFGRFVTLVTTAPILTKLTHGMNLKDYIVLFWLAKKGTLQMLFFLLIYHNRTANHIIQYFGGHVFVYIILTVLINGITEGIILRLFGLIGILPEKNAHMKDCIKYIYAKKDNFISSVKMNRGYLYTDWELVQQYTIMEDLMVSTVGEAQETQVKTRMYFCGDCKKEVILPPTKKELQHMSMIAKIRCLELHKTSFIRQAEHGLISNESRELLLNLLEEAKESEMKIIDVNVLLKNFRKKYWPEKVQMILTVFKLEQEYPRPRVPFRKLCYNITMNKYYELVIFAYVLFTFVVFNWYDNFYMDLGNVMLFGAHIYIKIQSYSHIYVKNGVKLFFENYWNIIDFIIFISAVTDLILVDLLDYIETSHFALDVSYFTLKSLTMLRCMRFLKLISVVYKFRKEVIFFCEKMISVRVAYGMEMSQGLVNSYDEILHMMPKIVENETVRGELIVKFKEDKKAFIDYINEAQRNTNWIAVTVKTKRVIRRSLYVMRRLLLDFKHKGLLGNSEFAKLMAAHEACNKFSLHLNRVPLNTPQNIFSELPWLYAQRDFSDMFFSFGIPMKWKAKETICGDGFVIPGIYVIVEGMVILKYNPANIEELAGIGALPCKDYMYDTEFMSPASIVLVPGNTFGEISVMTKRPNHCNAIADLPTKGYFIPIFLITQILSMKDTLEETGIYSSFWKHISQNLSTYLLWNTTMHRNMLREEANSYFRKGFVPNMRHHNFFVASDLIEDIVLVEGKVEDLSTGEIFVGPRTLRRSSTNLLLIEDNGVTPILFVLPINDAYTTGIMSSLLKSSMIAIANLERRISKNVDDVKKTSVKIRPTLRDSTELIKGKAVVPPLPKRVSDDDLQLTPSQMLSTKKHGRSALKLKNTKSQVGQSTDRFLLEDIEWISEDDLTKTVPAKEKPQDNQIRVTIDHSALEELKESLDIWETDNLQVPKRLSTKVNTAESAALQKVESRAINQFSREDSSSSHNLVKVVMKILKKIEGEENVRGEKKKITPEEKKKSIAEDLFFKKA